MSEYVSLPIATDPVDLAQQAITKLEEGIPSWNGAGGNLETWMIEACARIGAEVRDVASDVPAAIFRYFGATLADVKPIEAETATVASTWTMRDDAGYMVPAGTVVGLPGPDPTELVAFEVAHPITVPAGSTTTAPGAVLLRAVERGEAGNGLSGVPQLIDALGYVDSLALVGATAGGADDEHDADYLDRLRAELELMTPRPIRPRDFEVLARRIAGVERALAVDGYDPSDESLGNERMVTVFAIDAAGAAVDTATKDALAAELEAQREINFVVHVADPTYTPVDVSFEIAVEEGWTPSEVRTRAEAAVASLLSPANWGQPSTGDRRRWVSAPVVRLGELYAILNRVVGVDYVSALTLRRGADPFSAADVTLPGAAPLPQPGVIVGTA